MIVPMPPSRRRTGYQPVVEIASALADGLGKPINVTAVSKTKETPELKNVFDYQERLRLLQDAFQVNVESISGRALLLVDDLFRSGATATAVTGAFLKGHARSVYLLAITKTRTRT